MKASFSIHSTTIMWVAPLTVLCSRGGKGGHGGAVYCKLGMPFCFSARVRRQQATTVPARACGSRSRVRLPIVRWVASGVFVWFQTSGMHKRDKVHRGIKLEPCTTEDRWCGEIHPSLTGRARVAQEAWTSVRVYQRRVIERDG